MVGLRVGMAGGFGCAVRIRELLTMASKLCCRTEARPFRRCPRASQLDASRKRASAKNSESSTARKKIFEGPGWIRLAMYHWCEWRRSLSAPGQHMNDGRDNGAPVFVLPVAKDRPSGGSQGRGL